MARKPNQPVAKSGSRHWGRAEAGERKDPLERPDKGREPIVCPQCGAVLHRGRWQWAKRPDHATEELCEACRRIKDDYPAGIVTLTSPVVAEHGDEIVGLARNQEDAEKTDHPLNRIMAIDRSKRDRIVITTTDIHLPRRIARAVVKAFHGKSTEHYEKDGDFVRIEWQRE